MAKIKYNAEIAATTQKQEMTESAVTMRSGRIVAESEHEEVRLEVEAAVHLNGDALAGPTESEQPPEEIIRGKERVSLNGQRK